MRSTRNFVMALFLSGAALPCLAEASAEKHAYFGDLHLHTTLSFDAYVMFGTKTTPDEAYRFARGEAVPFMGHMVQRYWPLDFMAVTDHSESMGLMNQVDDPTSAFARTELGQKIIAAQGDKATGKNLMFEARNAASNGGISPEMLKGAGESAWRRVIADANKNYQPGKFTTFIGYEWSSMADDKYNLHRNVIYRNDTAPLPFSSIESPRPEDLWTYLETARKQGFDVIAIPHNANASNGLMYDWNDSYGKPIDRVYAQRRALNEPLAEIVQGKGQSETSPAISSNDEFGSFEVFDQLLTQVHMKSNPHGSYIREAYGRGLVIEKNVGVNPFKSGVVGGSDFHNGLSTSSENAYLGDNRGIDPAKDLPDAATARKIMDPNSGFSALDLTQTASGGLTGVWAEENTRDSIFSALKRKETFATSGTRLRVRFFGGWAYDRNLIENKDWTSAAYAQGVPMGGDLPAKPATARAPRFAVWAVKDPSSGNLDRAQVIKVWLDGDKYQEKIFDVVLSNGRVVDAKSGKAPDVGNTVDLKTATYQNTIGATELHAIWEDPEFDPKVPAVYYLRVLEIPTPRWSTILSVKDKLPLPTNMPPTTQERAWASPIWYVPPA
jgi:hypothetical protein